MAGSVAAEWPAYQNGPQRQRAWGEGAGKRGTIYLIPFGLLPLKFGLEVLEARAIDIPGEPPPIRDGFATENFFELVTAELASIVGFGIERLVCLLIRESKEG